MLGDIKKSAESLALSMKIAHDRGFQVGWVSINTTMGTLEGFKVSQIVPIDLGPDVQ